MMKDEGISEKEARTGERKIGQVQTEQQVGIRQTRKYFTETLGLK